MKKAELSNLTIKLQEIEDPEKGHGYSVNVTGRTNDEAATQLLFAMFEALEREYPEAFIPAVMAFMMEDLSPEDFMKIIR